jgi:glycosyltransferase involved in cell wall biosynthesis
MIRILITGPSPNNLPGGIRTHMKNFLDAFKHHKFIKIQFFPVTLGLYEAESWAPKIARNLRHIRPFLKAAKYSDIIHLNSTFDSRSVIRELLYLGLILFFLKKKVILQFHGGRPVDVKMLSNPIVRKVLQYALSKCSHILILSSIQASQFSEYFTKIHYRIVPNFINSDHVKMHNKKERSFVKFLFMARIDETKGVKEIIKAAKLLKTNDKQFEIIFCGEGPLKDWLTKSILEHSLTGIVSCFGYVFGDLKEKILTSSDVMLLPSSHKEGFPYSILEAFNHGLPVISSPIGAIPDIIEDGVNGFLIKPKDVETLVEKMKYFLENSDQIAIMGSNARHKVERMYSFKKLISVFEEIYQT